MFIMYLDQRTSLQILSEIIYIHMLKTTVVSYSPLPQIYYEKIQIYSIL